jgi:Flp pilus assembly pilin Flp
MITLQLKLTQLRRNRKGQDMVEYALLACFIAVTVGALLPPISDSTSVIFSEMKSVVWESAV